MEGGCTIAFVAKALISLMARGARFLNVTPWSCEILSVLLPPFYLPVNSTYPLVEVDGVFARNDISNRGSGGLGRRLLSLRRHICDVLGGPDLLEPTEEYSLRDKRTGECRDLLWMVLSFNSRN